jgi:hypothetical protein
MTEAEWLVCGEPRLLLSQLEQATDRRPSPRKLALAAVACADQIGRFIHDDLLLRAFRLLARGAEGIPLTSEVTNFRADFARRAEWYAPDLALWAVRILWPDETCNVPDVAARHVVHEMASYLATTEQCAVFREIIGNPFRRVTLDPSWRTSTVLALAESIYADRAFDRLPILADALQDAGCENADLLDHCRGPGPHVRGCWAVDLVLGKG